MRRPYPSVGHLCRINYLTLSDYDRLRVCRAQPVMHAMLAYHSLRRRRGSYAGYDSCKAEGGAKVPFDIKRFSTRSTNHGWRGLLLSRFFNPSSLLTILLEGSHPKQYRDRDQLR